MDIKEALGNLDTKNDDHWTANGDPKIDAIKELIGVSVTRQEIIDAAPGFNRENTDLESEEGETPDDEIPEEAEEQDTSAIEKYLDGEPLGIREFLDILKDVPSEQLEGFKNILQEQLSEVERAESKAKDYRILLKHSLASVRSRIKREVPDMSNQQAIAAYIQSSNNARANRYVKAEKAKEAVGTLNLDPLSPIDRAMARKTGRGTNRPKRL